jgi:hypothetical protein
MQIKKGEGIGGVAETTLNAEIAAIAEFGMQFVASNCDV